RDAAPTDRHSRARPKAEHRDGTSFFRRARYPRAGRWLRKHGLRKEFFLCTQICHQGWNETAQRSIDRFTSAAVNEDIANALSLLGTDYLDLVYLDDNPRAPFEPVIHAIGREIARGRVRPEYVPFDASLERVVCNLKLAVFAHASDHNLGLCLFEDADRQVHTRPQRTGRWRRPHNPALVQRVRQFAATRGLTPREVNVAWLLNRPFPVVAIVDLPSLSARGSEYARAARLQLDEGALT